MATNLYSRKSGRGILWVIMYVDHPSKKLALSGHQCAAKLLGVRDPKAAYDRLNFKEWKDALDSELHASGLSNAIRELTSEMVDRTRIMALLSETDTIAMHLKELRSVHGCVSLLYSPSTFTLLLADENSSRQGEPRTTMIPLKGVMIKLVNSSRLYWRPGRARRICKSRKIASCSKGRPH